MMRKINVNDAAIISNGKIIGDKRFIVIGNNYNDDFTKAAYSAGIVCSKNIPIYKTSVESLFAIPAEDFAIVIETWQCDEYNRTVMSFVKGDKVISHCDIPEVGLGKTAMNAFKKAGFKAGLLAPAEIDPNDLEFYYWDDVRDELAGISGLEMIRIYQQIA